MRGAMVAEAITAVYSTTSRSHKYVPLVLSFNVVCLQAKYNMSAFDIMGCRT